MENQCINVRCVEKRVRRAMCESMLRESIWKAYRFPARAVTKLSAPEMPFLLTTIKSIEYEIYQLTFVFLQPYVMGDQWEVVRVQWEALNAPMLKNCLKSSHANQPMPESETILQV